MAIVLGTRGTGNWATDERPKSWREMILYLLPNGDAPLMGLLSRTRPNEATDPEHSWWEKDLAEMEIEVAAFANATDTITVNSGAKLCPKGTLLLNNATGEVMRVTADPLLDTAVVVQRNLGGLANPANPADGNILAIFSSSYREGAPVPTAIGTDPVKRTSYTQIIRTSLAMTRTALQTSLRTGEAYRNAKIECLQIQSARMEMAVFLSVGNESTQDGLPIRTMRGIREMTTSWAPDNSKNVGNFTEDEYLGYDSAVFDYGNDPKIMFVGSHGQLQFIKMGKAGGTFNYVYGDRHWGLRISEFTATGSLQMVKHPLFRHMKNTMDKEAVVLDLPKIKYTPLRGKDLIFIQHRQSPGDDARVDEFLVEFTIEEWHAKAHYRLHNLGSYG